MQIGRIVKRLVCTIKDDSMEGTKILLVTLLDLDESENGDYVVVVENQLDLGMGDIVLVVSGSSARRISGNENMPIDGAIAAKIELFNIEKNINF